MRSPSPKTTGTPVCQIAGQKYPAAGARSHAVTASAAVQRDVRDGLQESDVFSVLCICLY